ncbi:pyrimidine/purine nucleoside phosphorylase [Dasania sp. GY-MA-18]|uniref:Pyrimidine/purine nucleoside phosphorylase n=1 Tax=Dasania phycosphaerae TaxID=2950436 RepID=A0A9J6RIT6_9GAMM|nr:MULTISPECIES: pyrimidine/purine nucleoside phosphorylase [Dasania]MCR8921465.1 pyrimidine/purine nucleoside phosphorylase [Dasania sp. GY-MA-18]MCZ0863893.1 pyrimidine/purine nucleoside phosphorylase [Dasania phycosphaerae]MCZ0867621.1 pyrimidine/purine nucleoside phosphorylase [Dasania phycosphaerae]
MFKINEYFEGKVASIAFQTSNLPATVGVMAIGSYKFGTTQKEVMTVVSGDLTVKLEGDSEWVNYQAGESFTITANSSFEVKVMVETAYLCTYE